jgi:hypothetical protein
MRGSVICSRIALVPTAKKSLSLFLLGLDTTDEFSGEKLSSKHCIQDFTGILSRFSVMLVHRFLMSWRNKLIFSECPAEI